MAKEKETSAEQHLKDLVSGRRTDIPEGGIPNVAITYQSGAKRTHDSLTKGPVVLTPEREVLVDVELEAGSIVIERVRFGYGPRTWRFPSPTDAPKRKQPPRRPEPRIVVAGNPPRMLGRESDIRQTHAETKQPWDGLHGKN